MAKACVRKVLTSITPGFRRTKAMKRFVQGWWGWHSVYSHKGFFLKPFAVIPPGQHFILGWMNDKKAGQIWICCPAVAKQFAKRQEGMLDIFYLHLVAFGKTILQSLQGITQTQPHLLFPLCIKANYVKSMLNEIILPFLSLFCPE